MQFKQTWLASIVKNIQMLAAYKLSDMTPFLYIAHDFDIYTFNSNFFQGKSQELFIVRKDYPSHMKKSTVGNKSKMKVKHMILQTTA